MANPYVLEALKKALAVELSAIEIYSAHAKAIQEEYIAEGVRAILEVEKRHAQELTERIRALGDTPIEPGGKETILGRAIGAASAHATTREMLELELREEQLAIKDYATFIAEITGDEETVALMERHLKDEIDHAKWLKRQIASLGG
ncbi:MAG: ferritin-like domain-containing protein [Anaerolineae bacterium]|nr:ferritin-like domain-containing protein [Anaerolineae bacterium]MDW8102710.1 ferritin-like domain-containing protein [Anaerolineae bacterium]